MRDLRLTRREFVKGCGSAAIVSATGGTLMACLALADVDWTRYVKWFMPLFICQSVLAFASLTVLQIMGWTGV